VSCSRHGHNHFKLAFLYKMSWKRPVSNSYHLKVKLHHHWRSFSVSSRPYSHFNYEISLQLHGVLLLTPTGTPLGDFRQRSQTTWLQPCLLSMGVLRWGTSVKDHKPLGCSPAFCLWDATVYRTEQNRTEQNKTEGFAQFIGTGCTWLLSVILALYWHSVLSKVGKLCFRVVAGVESFRHLVIVWPCGAVLRWEFYTWVKHAENEK